MDLIYITKHLNTHEKCIQYLEAKRWNGVPKCPYCGSEKTSPKRLRHTCSGCSNSFSVTVGTVFENSNLPLNKWFVAISIILSAKKGVSSLQLSRDIVVNKNTAWLLQMKIRSAMADGWLEGFLSEKTLTCLKKRKFVAGKSKLRIPFTFKMSDVVRIDGFWSHLKRAVIGQFHRIDEYYLNRYVDEINFKRSFRSSPDSGFEELMKRLLLCLYAK